MKLIHSKKCLVFLSVFITVFSVSSLSGSAQKDPNARVINELNSDRIKNPSHRGLKIYSNGDIEFKDGRIIKKDGTVYYSNGKVIKRNKNSTGEHKGRRILSGGIIAGQDGKTEDVCAKSDECKKFRAANFTSEGGVWKPKN